MLAPGAGVGASPPCSIAESIPFSFANPVLQQPLPKIALFPLNCADAPCPCQAGEQRSQSQVGGTTAACPCSRHTCTGDVTRIPGAIRGLPSGVGRWRVVGLLCLVMAGGLRVRRDPPDPILKHRVMRNVFPAAVSPPGTGWEKTRWDGQSGLD